jgi:hypothetical protein
MSELMVFISQFLVVFLLGVQSLMVRDSNCLGAAFGSVLIGVSQFYIFSIIGGMGPSDIGTIKFFAFVSAGPCAIVASIKLHPHINRLIFNRKSE